MEAAELWCSGRGRLRTPCSAATLAAWPATAGVTEVAAWLAAPKGVGSCAGAGFAVGACGLFWKAGRNEVDGRAAGCWAAAEPDASGGAGWISGAGGCRCGGAAGGCVRAGGCEKAATAAATAPVLTGW